MGIIVRTTVRDRVCYREKRKKQDNAYPASIIMNTEIHKIQHLTLINIMTINLTESQIYLNLKNGIQLLRKASWRKGSIYTI